MVAFGLWNKLFAKASSFVILEYIKSFSPTNRRRMSVALLSWAVDKGVKRRAKCVVGFFNYTTSKFALKKWKIFWEWHVFVQI